MNKNEKLDRLKSLFCEIEQLRQICEILVWDQNTHMPAQGGLARSRQLELVGKLSHEKLTGDEVASLLDALDGYEHGLSYDSVDACFLRHARLSHARAARVPSHVMASIIAHQSVCYESWIRAKEENNFSLVQADLEKNLELSQQYASFYPFAHVADPLIAESDFGFTTQSVATLFAQLRAELVPLLLQVLQAQPACDDGFLYRSYPVPLQRSFCRSIAEFLGFDFRRGQLDETHHPFMVGFSAGDIRITTRYKEDDLCNALFSVLHETGHALYELGCAPELDGTSLFGGTSSGVHESQSRLWENIVGRSLPFWKIFFPELQKIFPEQLRGLDSDDFYRAINKVSPSLIRIDADELTYNLHIMIRFELELELLQGKLKVKDLPEAWNALYQRDLGLVPKTLGEGCLQDVHWFSGPLGGQFQSYTLGNIMSAQFYEAALAANPLLPTEIDQGNFQGLHQWLIRNLYCHGKKYTGCEVLHKATKKDLTIQPYLKYLREKFLPVERF